MLLACTSPQFKTVLASSLGENLHPQTISMLIPLFQAHSTELFSIWFSDNLTERIAKWWSIIAVNFQSIIHQICQPCDARQSIEEVNYDGQLTIIESLIASCNYKSWARRPHRRHRVISGCSESLLSNASLDTNTENVGHDFLFVPTAQLVFYTFVWQINWSASFLLLMPSSTLKYTHQTDGSHPYD